MSTTDIRPCPRCGLVREVRKTTTLCKDCQRTPAADQGPERVAQLAGYSINRAAEFACLVRDEGRDGIGAYLRRLDPQQTWALCVALAAMVPVDRTPEELLGWLREFEAVAA